MTATLRALVVAALIAAAVPAAAQTPRLTNGRLETHPVASGLARDFQPVASRLTEPAWVGYAVPVVEGDAFMCDWTDRSRAVSTAPVHWFTGVTAADSVAFLKTFVTHMATGRMADGAVSAIAMHAGAQALDTLLALAHHDASAKVRGQALFWLGQRAGQKAVGAITAAIEQDPDTDVKKKAVFALSQLPKDEGVPLLIAAARSNKNPAVRKQAMFWLGQSRDPRALGFFEEILRK